MTSPYLVPHLPISSARTAKQNVTKKIRASQPDVRSRHSSGLLNRLFRKAWGCSDSGRALGLYESATSRCRPGVILCERLLLSSRSDDLRSMRTSILPSLGPTGDVASQEERVTQAPDRRRGRMPLLRRRRLRLHPARCPGFPAGYDAQDDLPASRAQANPAGNRAPSRRRPPL